MRSFNIQQLGYTLSSSCVQESYWRDLSKQDDFKVVNRKGAIRCLGPVSIQITMFSEQFDNSRPFPASWAVHCPWQERFKRKVSLNLLYLHADPSSPDVSVCSFYLEMIQIYWLLFGSSEQSISITSIIYSSYLCPTKIF